MSDVTSFRAALTRRVADLRFACRLVKTEKAALKAAVVDLDHSVEARDLVQAVAAGVQQRVHDRLAGLVNDCLRAVFGPGVEEFRVVFSPKRGKTEARLAWVKAGHEVPTEDVGYGVWDVAAFALRLAAVMTRSGRRRVLVLDEPFRHIDKDVAPRVREMLETVAETLDAQVILSTHNQDLVCGKVVHLTGKGKKNDLGPAEGPDAERGGGVTAPNPGRHRPGKPHQGGRRVPPGKGH